MLITINVNVTGLEPLVSALEKIISTVPGGVSPNQGPTLSVVPPVQSVGMPAPVMTATAPALAVVHSPAPQAAPVMQAAPAPVMQAAPVAQAVPTAVQSYTMDQLAVAGTQLIDAGRMAELQGLLAAFGVQALTQLPKEQYGAFATQLRAMGAKI